MLQFLHLPSLEKLYALEFNLELILIPALRSNAVDKSELADLFECVLIEEFHNLSGVAQDWVNDDFTEDILETDSKFQLQRYEDLKSYVRGDKLYMTTSNEVLARQVLTDNFDCLDAETMREYIAPGNPFGAIRYSRYVEYYHQRGGTSPY
jgi:hypothetical protein